MVVARVGCGHDRNSAIDPLLLGAKAAGSAGESAGRIHTAVLARRCRARVESPSAPGQSMTRQELAEAINAYVYRASGGTQVTAVDFNQVGKWERGVIRWPAARYRAAMRAILDVDTDRDLGFARPARGKPQDVDRKTFLKATLGTSAGAVLARYAPATGGDSGDLIAAMSGRPRTTAAWNRRCPRSG